MSLDICAANKSHLEDAFGSDLMRKVYTGYHDNVIFGCRHKLKNCKYSCFHFINKKTEYISSQYEPVNEEVCFKT